MEILNYIMWYLFIGTIFTFLVDVINNWLSSNAHRIDYIPPTDEDWGMVERIVSIILWPFAMYVFIAAFYKRNKK